MEYEGPAYGFEAIADRYRVLAGTPIELNEEHLHNLANLVQQMYGARYIGNPKMRRLAERNGITLRDFADGQNEPEMFARGDYLGLRLSTLRKVEVIAEIGELAQRYKLKTDTNWFARNWGTFTGCVEWIAENKIFALITSLICLGIGIGFLGAYFGYVALHLGAAANH